MNQSKQTGTLAETAVATALLGEGFSVSFAHGENTPWDLISDYEGKVNRLQVKTASRHRMRGDYHVSLVMGSGVKYTKDHIDFLIIWLPYSEDFDGIGYDGLYVIPVKEVKVTTCRCWPAGFGATNTLCKWEKWRNKFNLLK